MKKLLVLMLVLGMVSAANATVVFYYGDSDAGTSVDVVAGGSITLQVYDDNTTQDGYIAYWYVDWGEPGTLTNGAYTANAGSSAVIAAYTETGVGTGYEMQSMSVADDIAVGVQWTADFDATGLTQGQSATLSIYDGRIGYSTADTLTVNVVPEPLTIALLGLGGLFLRRRK
jgi:hypothetical protein